MHLFFPGARSRAAIRLILLLLCAAVCAAEPRAQAAPRLLLTELLLDPVGPNAGAQVLEVENTGSVPVDLAGWHLLVEPTAAPLPPLQLPIGAIARVHLGAAGGNTIQDLYLPGFRELGRSETVALYRSARFHDPADMVDFVSCNGGQGRMNEAIRAGQWPSAAETVLVPAAEGQTLAHYGAHVWGSGDEAAAWYQDGTPTLGRANDPGSTFGMAYGCPQVPNVPWLGLARPETRPWLGEQWVVDLHQLPPAPGTAVLILGVRSLVPPVPLDPIGMTGCRLLVSLDATFAVPFAAPQAQWSLRVPADAGLVGGVVHLQAWVPDPAAGNAARALMTNALVATIGSR
jgi:hypothetical protein